MINQKHILIIGGMGPQASIHAHQQIIKECQKITDQLNNNSYPRITHLSINTDDFISDPEKKTKSLQYILECLEEIDIDSVTAGFISCNTAHILFDDIQATTKGKIISIIDTAKECAGAHRVGLVATPTTLKANLYDIKNLLTPDQQSSDNIESIIREVISNGASDNLARRLEIEIEKLKLKGAEQVILGCSELSILGDLLSFDYTIDPINLTIKKILGLKTC